MEKLIELLNEWSKTALENKCNWTDVYDEEGVYFVNLFDRDMTMEMEDVISKRNGFIKWLVDNDKIKIPHELDELPQIYGVDYDSKESKSDRLIMLLSVSESPIEFLISILR